MKIKSCSDLEVRCNESDVKLGYGNLNPGFTGDERRGQLEGLYW